MSCGDHLIVVKWKRPTASFLVLSYSIGLEVVLISRIVLLEE